MMTVALLLAAVTIAFPREGAKLPFVSRVYVLGATDGGETNLVIGGRNVAVHRSGAWTTMVDLVPGTNAVEVGGLCRRFTVAAPEPLKIPSEPPRKYEKLAYAADVPKPHPCGRAADTITVVLDPGHGGSDTGALSPHGRPEKEANLALALDVRRELVARGYRVEMTRDDDSFPALYDRPKVAHAAKADAFISIHHNAPPYEKDPRTFRYHTVYCWNDLGERLAKPINARMGAAFGKELANNGVQRANYAVTRNPEIPSCLIEVDFVTSPDGEEAIWNADRRQQAAAAIAAGFDDWSRQP